MMQPTSCPPQTPQLISCPIRSKISLPLSTWLNSAGNGVNTQTLAGVQIWTEGCLTSVTLFVLLSRSWHSESDLMSGMSTLDFFTLIFTLTSISQPTGHYQDWVKPSDTLIVCVIAHLQFLLSSKDVSLRRTLFSLFFSELLLNKHLEFFQSWVYPLSHELILHSIRNPLVSGFYKLLSVTMKIAKRIKYYQVIFALVCHPISCFCCHHTGLCVRAIWKIIWAFKTSTNGPCYWSIRLCFPSGLTNDMH